MKVLTVATKKPEPYNAALRAAGLEPVYGDSLDGCTGLLLQGGTDVNPDLYGEEPLPTTSAPDEERDEKELWLINDALERDLPILAICRGAQLLNVAHGGTLIQHLTPEAKCAAHKATHMVKIAAGSSLAKIFGSSLEVNSRHHQAIAKAGGGLVITARSEDKVVEAIERPDKAFVLGVQWHPEDLPAHAALFEAFAEAAKASR